MTNCAKVGGILSIVAGAFGVFWFIMAILFIVITVAANSFPDGFYDYGYAGALPVVIFVFYIIWGLIMTLFGALAIVGGIFALRRKVWGLALAGAIAGALVFFPCGIVAIIFTALGKPEFDIKPGPGSAPIQT
jgi:hypothetical protein